MKTQHTPGPWTLLPCGGEIDLKGNNGNTLIACFPAPMKIEGVAFGPSEEDPANLRLIAAAPELLGALEESLGWLEAALAGEPDGWANSNLALAVKQARAAIAKATGKASQ